MIRKILALLAFTIVSSSFLFGQNIPKGFNLYKTISSANDLKHGIISEILIDSVLGYIMVDYDYHPTYIEIFDLNTCRKLERLKIWNFIYLSESYLDKNGEFIYFEVGRWKSRYIKVDMKTFKKERVSCKKSPKGCDYDNLERIPTYNIQNRTILAERYFLKVSNKQIDIYIKK